MIEEVLQHESVQLPFCSKPRCWIGSRGCVRPSPGGRSQALLEEVERAGLFLVPLDEVRGWWRYHHLFGDLLRARLQQEQPGRVVLPPGTRRPGMTTTKWPMT